MIFLVHKQT